MDAHINKGRRQWTKLFALTILALVVFFVSSYRWLRHDVPEFNAETRVELDAHYQETNEKAVLVDDGPTALKARLDLIERAEETLYMSVFAMQGGDSMTLIYNALLEAAERGVEVKLLVDGLFHGMRFKDRQFISTAHDTPFIDIKFYEPLNILAPWRLHNRLHDKIIIQDEQHMIISGRNIGDKYFKRRGDNLTYDREILIVNPADSSPLINQAREYFTMLWDHDFVRTQNIPILASSRQRRNYRYDLKLEATKVKAHHQSFFAQSIDWSEYAHPIDRGYFIYNQPERSYKHADVFHHLLTHLHHTQTDVEVYSPYIIFTDSMLQDIKKAMNQQPSIHLVTNGVKSTPNWLAFSGYQLTRPYLNQENVTINEYQHRSASLHLKSYMFDESTLAVGSYNLDPRSAYINTESMIFIESASLAEEAKKSAESTFAANLIATEDEPVVSFSIRLKHTLINVLSHFTSFALPLL